MPTRVSRRAVLSLCGAAPLIAKDHWQDQKYTEWDEKQMQKIMSDSPWVKKVTASMGLAGGTGGGMGGGGGRGRGGGGGGGMGGGGMPSADTMGSGDGGMNAGMGGGGGRGGGGMGGGGMQGGGGAAPPSMTVIVRWLSALPLRQVNARRLKRDVSDAPASYLIGVFGLPAQLAQRAPDQFKGMLKKSTHLKIKGRDPIEPEQVDLGLSADQTVVALFQFSKKEPISLDDKEVEFVTRLGPMEFKTKFKTKDMMFGGQLAV